jgi:hypothetical protein
MIPCRSNVILFRLSSLYPFSVLLTVRFFASHEDSHAATL